jgi:ADP-ribose pyrophosphatase
VTGPHAYAVRARDVRFAGPLFSVVSDEVAMPGGVARRDYLRHPGAVGVVAVDDDGRVVLIRQYRHPIGQFMWELPAGLTDVAGEPAELTAARELAEEADLAAARWEPLVDFFTTPGCSDERMRVYLARDLTDVPADQRHLREQEEAELTVARFDLDEAVRMVFAGEIVNGPCALGLLAAATLLGRS